MRSRDPRYSTSSAGVSPSIRGSHEGQNPEASLATGQVRRLRRRNMDAENGGKVSLDGHKKTIKDQRLSIQYAYWREIRQTVRVR